jgi:CrcB protein
VRLDGRELAAIFIGGAVGGAARVELTQLFPSGPESWPWAVFTINISGAFLLGYLLTRLQERLPLSTYRRQLTGTGFCGALTTFSTMQLQVLHMLDHRCYGLAAGYLGASVVCGLLAIYASTALTRRVRLIL